ncbi:hypothetical protein O181_078947 [Austropuccinia psidii MF-1]|uniref:Uncharacterized protein n=1 Tax=Austropuccinia psidii MF-1 TaxID=1389203 RepID=A0A9Q3IG21_9BASI|nr:hypothetical protein [Austropuccinia psidii MF-1]
MQYHLFRSINWLDYFLSQLNNPYSTSSYSYNNYIPQAPHYQELEDLRNVISEKDKVILTLVSKVESLKVNSGSKKPQRMKPNVEKPITMLKKKKKSNKSKNDKKNKACEEPKKRHPLQLLMCEVPEDFQYTKDAIFIHIRILWGMIKQKSLPPSPDQSLLKEFNMLFSNNDELENVAKSNTCAVLISEEEVQMLCDACAGRQKIGKHIVNLDDFYFQYIRYLLSKFGICIWAPDLEAAPGSLYNEACRTIAIMTFRQVACSGAYQYMRANLSYLNNIDLIHRAYNHYVHYHMTEKFKKEIKETGKNLADDQKGVTQQRRQRLCKKRYRFAAANNYPDRYLRVLADVNSHSDDELIPKRQAYAIKILPYRSESANIFFRNLDRKMNESNELAGKSAPLRPRCRPRVPIPSTFKKAPQKMPLDFYRPEWFNKIDYGERFLIANTKQVAFIPTNDIEMSKKLNPDENLGDKAFNKKYWDLVTEPYDLSHEIAESSEEEDEETESESNDLMDGDSLDLEDSDENQSDDDRAEGDDQYNKEKNTQSQHTWTQDVDDEMVDDFEVGTSNQHNAFFEDDLDETVWK